MRHLIRNGIFASTSMITRVTCCASDAERALRRAERFTALKNLAMLCVLVLSQLLIFSMTARADVGGTPQTLYRQFQVFGGAKVTGNTLMGASIAQPLVNSRLLSSSPGDISGIPFDGELQGAYLFWSGSTLNTPDRNVDFTLPDGTVYNDLGAERCLTLNGFGGFFACRADVTQLIVDHPGAQRYNGRYTVGDLSAEPGTLNANGECVEPRECQAKYAAWSLILVYSSPSSATLRDVTIYDGFLSLDENATSSGITSYNIAGFDFPQDGQASISYFGMEGDALLGVPPQDTDPNPGLRCSTCFDFFEVNGTKLNDANNPPNNVFNSSSEIGYTLGVDLDSFDISSLLSAGDSQINLRVGSGDGRVNPMNPDPGGGGELFLLSYIMLSVDRNAPNFNREGTSFTVIPDEAAPLERVVFTLRVDNQGSLSARGVSAQVNLPTGLSYFPGSLRVDGVDPVPGQEVQNPLETGFELGVIPFQGDTDRVLTFRASIDQGVAAGTQLVTPAVINADNIVTPTNLRAIVNVLGVPPLGQPTKVAIDGDGDDLFAPGEVIQYRITIPNPNSRPISGVRLVDVLPPYLDILQVISGGGGLDLTDLALNRVQLDNLNIPANRSIDIVIVAQIHEADLLEADGVDPSEIDGLVISNQAEVTLGADRRLTDDPATSASDDPTVFVLSAGVDIRGNGTRKEVRDLNGGLLEPGDLIEYSIRVRNTGASGGTVRLNDPLPPSLDECVISSAPPAISCEEISGRWRVRGELEMSADDVARVTFTARVRPQTEGGTAIVNIATLSVESDPTQIVNTQSPRLVVFASPDLQLEKRALSGSSVVRGGLVRYELTVRNVGNRPASGVVLVDPISYLTLDGRPSDGGQWTPATPLSSAQARWELGEVEAGGERRVTLEVDLNPAIVGGTALQNQASLAYAELSGVTVSDDPDTPIEDDPTVISVTGEGALLNLTKTVAPTAPLPGDRVTYTIIARNVGDAPLINVVVTDPFPPQLSDLSAALGRVNGQEVTFDNVSAPALSIIDPGESVTLSVSATLGAVAPNTRVSNQASGQAEAAEQVLSDDPNTPALNDPTSFLTGTPPRLSLVKRVEDLNGGSVEPGDVLRYTLTARHEEGATATQVRITDPIPRGLTAVSPLDGGSLVSNNILWSLGDLNQDRREVAVRFEATVSAQSSDGERIANQALIRANNIGEVGRSDDPSTSELGDPTVVTVSSRAELSVAFKRVSPREVRPGEEVEWTIEVENRGPSVARDVVITDPVSEWLTELSSPNGIISGGRVVWRVGELGVNQRRSFILRARLSAEVSLDQLVANQAEISGRNLPDTRTDDPDTPALGDPTALTILAPPEVRFTKEVRGPRAAARPGEQATYVIRVANTSSAQLESLIITDTLPAGLSPTSALGGVITGNTVTWAIDSLAPNQERSLELEVSVSPSAPIGDELLNQASLRASGGLSALSDDPTTAAAIDPTALRIIGAADLQLTKRVIALDEPPFRSGGRVRYELEVRNIGSEVAELISVVDPIPGDLTQVTSADGQVTPAQVSWSIPSLEAGAQRAISFDAVIREETQAGTIVSNRAEASREGAVEPTLSDDPATPLIDPTQFEVRADAQLLLSKTFAREDGRPEITAGAVVVYTITVQNDGPGASAPQEVTDDLSPSLRPVDERVWTGSSGITAQIQGQRARWALPALSEGERVTLVVGVEVRDAALVGAEILNQAESRPSDDPNAPPLLSDDPNTPVFGDPTAFTVSGRVDIALEKRLLSAESNFAPGGEVEYEITLINLSGQAQRDVSVSDSLPEGLTLVTSQPRALQGDNRVLLWSPVDLEPNGRVTYLLTARVNDTQVEGAVISNQARGLTAGGAVTLSDDPTTPALLDPTSFTVSSAPRLELTKTLRDVNGPPLSPGDLVEFSLTLRNLGGRTARDLEVIDPLSALLVDVNPVGGELTDRIARWRVLQLPAGEARSFTLTGRLSPNARDGDLLTNQFAARAPGDAFTLSPEVSATVQTAQLTFTKRATPILTERFVAGGQVQYTLTLSNVGQTSLRDVVISDQYSREALRDVLASDGGVVTEREITWDSSTTPALEEIPPGDSVRLTINAQLNDSLAVGSVIVNQAVTQLEGGDPSLDPYLSDDPDTPRVGDVTQFVISEGAALRFTKTIVEPMSRLQIEPGDRVVYQLVIENIGQRASSVLRVEDIPDPNLRVINLEVNGVSADPLQITRGDLVIEPIEPQGRVSILVSCALSRDARAGAEVLNQATLSYETAQGEQRASSDDPNTPEPNDPTAFVVSGDVTLRVDKFALTERGLPTARENEIITWSIVITNDGLAPALRLSLRDVVPEQVTYLSDSLRLNGRPISDALDRDEGEVEGGVITARFAQLGASERVELSFQTRVRPVSAGEDRVENQAFVLFEGSSSEVASDSDGDPRNGATPTAVALEQPLTKRYSAALTLNDPSGPPAEIGDSVEAEVLISNLGSAPLTELELTLPTAAGLIYERATVDQPEADAQFEPAPAPGPNQPPADPAGVVKVTGLALEAGESARLTVQLKVDPLLEQSAALCLQGTLRDLNHNPDVDPDDGVMTTERSCFDARVVFGRVRGEVFQDLNRDERFSADDDIAFEGMIVSAWRAGEAEGAPLATDFSDADGKYELTNLRPGLYEVRLKSSQGVAYQKKQVEVVSLEIAELALTVEPTGRVYESVSGDLLDGAELFIYRDLDADDDPFDDESLALRELVAESELESPTQQGQRSAQGGMYRFGVKRPGRYLIEVIPPGVRYVSPSTLVPPLPVSVSASDDIIELVPNALPSADSAEERRYTLAFEVGGANPDGALQLRNNHIALDPISALIQVDKRSRRIQYTVGEVVTYEIDIINRSPRDLIYDETRRAGGVYLEDVMPKGLKFVARSAVWVEVIGARERPLLSADPSGGRILRFGRAEVIADEAGAPQAVQRPIDLRAGAHLRLRYQAVIAPNAKPMRSYINRARLLAEGDVPISEVARAEIRVIADPDFDQGLLLGRVWCDENRDGLQGEDERGLMGARIYFDSGMYAVTDSAGKYHFKMIDPGSHAVKIDTNTLLPGAELTTDETRMIYFTRGLPAKVDFGVTCPVETTRDSEVDLGETALREALARLGREAVILSGDLNKRSVEIGELSFSPPNVDVKAVIEGEVPDLKPPTGGAPLEPIIFKTELSEETRSEVERWSLWVAREGAEERPVLSGLGAPPTELSWDGRDSLGRLVARRGLVLSYRFEIATSKEVISGPLHRLGVGVTVPPEPELLLTFRASPFDVDDPSLISPEDQGRLSEVVARLRQGYEGRLIVESHAGGEEDAPFLTNLRAEAIAELLREQLKLKEGDVAARGSANLHPFATNLTLLSRRRNRRVEIRLEQLKPDPKAVELLKRPIEVAAIARAGADERRPNQAGRFVMVTKIPEHGVVELYLRDKRGAAVTYQLTLSAGELNTKSAQDQSDEGGRVARRSRPLSLGGVWGRELSIGGSPLPAQLFDATLKLNPSEAGEVSVEPSFDMSASALGEGVSLKVNSWSLIVVDGGTPLEVERGDGPLPKTLTWSPLEPLTAERRVAIKFKVEGRISRAGQLTKPSGLSGRVLIESAPLWLSARDEQAIALDLSASVDPKRADAWRLKLGKSEIKGAPGARLEKVLTVPSGGSLSLELTRPSGSRLIGSLIPPRSGRSSQAKSRTNNSISSTSAEPQRAPSASKRPPKVRRSSQREMNLWMGGGIGWQIDELLTPTQRAQSPLQVNLLLPSDALVGGGKRDAAGGAQVSAKSATQSTAQTSAITPIKSVKQGSSQDPSKDPSKGTSGDVSGGPNVQSTRLKRARFGSQELLKASGALLRSRAPEVAAQDISVQLPQGESLSDPNTPVSGQTRPGNRVYLNGVEVRVDSEGRFNGVALVGDDGVLEVKVVDPDGNTARARRVYKLADRAWFLLAMSEGLSGSLGAELDGVQAHTSTKVGDQIYVHGRAVAYLKGRMKGDQILGGLFKKIEVTAHLDTAKRQEFEGYFRQMIDPDRYYPVYGDSAEEVNDVNSRGPLYVLVKADKSLLQVGNFRTLIRGVELLHYDRSLYGAQVSLDYTQGQWQHQAQVFGATQDQPERHAYVELRGTGGSLYYLPHREVVEGSERVYLVERDRISNMERRRVSLTRNIDYSIRYPDGRVLMMRPVTTSTLETTGALPQPIGSQQVLDGHPTFISIEYDHRDAKDRGEDAWGAYVRETWSDKKSKKVSVGGGFIQEQQGEVAAGHYRLWGGHVAYQHARKTGFAFEYAKSVNQNAENLFSQDGGLTFQPFNRRSDQRDPSGDSFLIKASAELDDFVGKGDRDWIWVEAYWRYAAPGFYAGANLQQQGSENYGVKVNYKLDEHHSFSLAYDEMATEQTPFEVSPFLTDYRRAVTRIGHRYQKEKLTLDSAWTQTVNEQGFDQNGELPPSFSNDALSVAAQYKLTSKLTLLGEQEIVVRGDSRLYQETSDLFVTSAGARYQLSESLSVEAVQSLRWSGDNATQLGVRSELSGSRTLYAQQRFVDQLGRKQNTTVVGAEERFAQGARAFSEYQLESGQLGQRNRAVIGLGKRTQLFKGLVIDASYQRSQVLNNFSQAGGLGGDLSQDALSLAVEWLAHPKLKASSRLEVRFDDFDEWQGRRDKNQLLTLNNVSYQLNQDLTLQLRFNYSVTEDELFKSTEAEFMEASFGAAYRPKRRSWLTILFKATSRFEQRPIDLTLERPEVEEMGVISLIPIFELPYDLQLVEKVAYKRSGLIVANLPSVVSHNVLWINRLNYHMTNTWDIGAEYRILQSTLAQSTQHGALFELNYIVKNALRLGVGYNFTDFSDDEFARFDERYGGPFFRVMAHY